MAAGLQGTRGGSGRALALVWPMVLVMGWFGGCGRGGDGVEGGVEEAAAASFGGFGQARQQKPRFLTPPVLEQIRAGQARWKGIVIHASDGRGETPKALERHHSQVLELPGGLAWHFLIGEGERMPEGEIFVGPRWASQQDGEAFAAADEAGLIHICLLGDSREAASAAQLAALDELLNFLLIRFGDLPISTHQEHEAVGNECPGERLSAALREQLADAWPRSVPQAVQGEEVAPEATSSKTEQGQGQAEPSA